MIPTNNSIVENHSKGKEKPGEGQLASIIDIIGASCDVITYSDDQQPKSHVYASLYNKRDRDDSEKFLRGIQQSIKRKSKRLSTMHNRSNTSHTSHKTNQRTILTQEDEGLCKKTRSHSPKHNFFKLTDKTNMEIDPSEDTTDSTLIFNVETSNNFASLIPDEENKAQQKQAKTIAKVIQENKRRMTKTSIPQSSTLQNKDFPTQGKDFPSTAKKKSMENTTSQGHELLQSEARNKEKIPPINILYQDSKDIKTIISCEAKQITFYKAYQ